MAKRIINLIDGNKSVVDDLNNLARTSLLGSLQRFSVYILLQSMFVWLLVDVLNNVDFSEMVGAKHYTFALYLYAGLFAITNIFYLWGFIKGVTGDVKSLGVVKRVKVVEAGLRRDAKEAIDLEEFSPDMFNELTSGLEILSFSLSAVKEILEEKR